MLYNIRHCAPGDVPALVQLCAKHAAHERACYSSDDKVRRLTAANFGGTGTFVSAVPVLNRAGKKTGRGNGWTQSRVCSLRSHNAIATYLEGERRERGEVTLDEAAAALSVSPSTVRRLIKDSQLAASQLCKGAPWIIKAADLERADVKSAATARRLRRPPSGDPLQKALEL